MIKLEDTRDPDMTIVVTGYQWKWHYAYQGEDVAFYSSLARPSATARRRGSGIAASSVDNYLLDVDRPLVVPKGAKVRVLLTSNDVVHSWWVPDFAVKKDAIPGFMNETWFQAEEAGTYPRPVRRAVRQGPRLHADRRRGRRARGIPGMDCGRKG